MISNCPKMNATTLNALSARCLANEDLARLLNCTEQHVDDILRGLVVPSSTEIAVLKLCANVRRAKLAPILRDLASDYEWRRIPGYLRYEASEHGQVRRASAGHGSMPGHVLRAKKSREGHLYVNVAPDGGPVRQLSVHRAVCLAFHGLAPSHQHVVCHRNDIPADNRKANLYWGTHQQNADDRERNSLAKSGTRLTQRANFLAQMTPRQIKKRTKLSMLYRLSKLNAG